MKDVVFTSYAFGTLYCSQQERLKRSIQDLYPDANIRFWKSVKNHYDDVVMLPPGSKTHGDSMYGFKVHCINNCIQEGFKKIIFLDPACVIAPGLEQILENLTKHGVMAAEDGTALRGHISNKCCDYIGKTREDVDHLTLVGGSVYLFDFNHPITKPFFDEFYKMEQDGIFGSQQECIDGGGVGGVWNDHRMDETCFSLCMDKFGLKSSKADASKEHDSSWMGTKIGNPETVFYKFHHDAYEEIAEHTIWRGHINYPKGIENSNVLDLGCRNFHFTNELKKRGHNVYSVDIDLLPESGDQYYRIGISDKDGTCGIVKSQDPNATHITDGDEILMISLDSFTKSVGVEHWDLIKLDIEGEELKVLKSANHPIADQLSVEFHAHCTEQTKESIDDTLEYLRKWYYVDRIIWENRHYAGENYWDVLLISKNIYSKEEGKSL